MSSRAAASIVVRACRGIEEYEACVRLQKDVWNFSDLDLVPLRMFVVAEKIGGQIIGSFDGSDMVGFALSIPGSRSGHPYLHSHMLAVREDYRNAGVGRRMKLAQRDDALARGFELIEWTFDPLEIKNAYLNLEKLGAIARRYTVNQYGYSSSPLQGGLPTDRLVADAMPVLIAGAMPVSTTRRTSMPHGTPAKSSIGIGHFEFSPAQISAMSRV